MFASTIFTSRQIRLATIAYGWESLRGKMATVKLTETDCRALELLLNCASKVRVGVCIFFLPAPFLSPCTCLLTYPRAARGKRPLPARICHAARRPGDRAGADSSRAPGGRHRAPGQGSAQRAPQSHPEMVSSLRRALPCRGSVLGHALRCPPHPHMHQFLLLKKRLCCCC